MSAQQAGRNGWELQGVSVHQGISLSQEEYVDDVIQTRELYKELPVAFFTRAWL